MEKFFVQKFLCLSASGCYFFIDYYFYVQSDTLFLTNVFACFNTAPGLVWLAVLEKTKVKLDLLTVIDLLLMAEKGIKGGTCHVIQQYAKANNKYKKKYDKKKESSYLKYSDVNNLYE